MPFIDFKSMPAVKIWDGIAGPIAYSDKMMFGYLSIEADCILPEHQHPHEQWSHLLEGEIIFKIGDEEMHMKPGMTAYIPGNVPHSGRSLTKVTFLDCFNPIREDWVQKEKEQLG